MTGEREIVIPAADLTRIAIACKACGAEISGDLQDERHYRLRAKEEPIVCPMCRTEFDYRIRPALGHFADWVRLISEAAHPVRFRIKEPDDA